MGSARKYVLLLANIIFDQRACKHVKGHELEKKLCLHHSSYDGIRTMKIFRSLNFYDDAHYHKNMTCKVDVAM